MWSGFELYLPLLLASGAIVSFVLLLVQVRKRLWPSTRGKKRPFISPSQELSVAALPPYQNGHTRHSLSLAPTTTTFSETWFNQLKRSSVDEQFRLLSALSAERRNQFIDGLTFEAQAELWAILPLETWAIWLTNNTPLLPQEQRELYQVLVFCNHYFRVWAAQCDELSSTQQSRLWTRLDLGQQEILWQRLSLLRRILLRQQAQRRQQLTTWRQLVPAAQVKLWLTLNQTERLTLWEGYPPYFWTRLWLALDTDLRTQFWESLDAAQRRRLRRYLQKTG
ncbi:MAG: hypothetical protein R6X32_05145 [Chloroflexota bacterium]|jgi:hypothetical protein